MTSFRNSVFSYSAGQSCTFMVWIEDTPSYSLVEVHGLDVGMGPQDQHLYPCLEPGGWHGAERGGGEGGLHTTVCSLCAAPLSWAQWLRSKSSWLVFGDAEREIESTEKILGYQPKIKLMFEPWGHSMSNQHKKILTLSDLNETWFVHSV